MTSTVIKQEVLKLMAIQQQSMTGTDIKQEVTKNSTKMFKKFLFP